jgi:hypothetical protein
MNKEILPETKKFLENEREFIQNLNHVIDHLSTAIDYEDWGNVKLAYNELIILREKEVKKKRAGDNIVIQENI